jgi:hypothetical protein
MNPAAELAGGDAFRYFALAVRDARPTPLPKPKPDLLDAPNTMAFRPGIGTSLTIDMWKMFKDRKRQRETRPKGLTPSRSMFHLRSHGPSAARISAGRYRRGSDGSAEVG